jgi:hypothetical protein
MTIEHSHSNPMPEIPQADEVQIIHDCLTKSSGRHRDASQRSPAAQQGSPKAARRAHYTTAWDVPNAK